MTQTGALRPEDIEIQTFAPLTPGVHFVDEDPVDPASGYDDVAPSPQGGTTRV
jgi:hypothetical protein